MPRKKLNLKTVRYKVQNLWDVKLILESRCDNNVWLFALGQSICLYPLQSAAHYLLLFTIADITLCWLLLHFHQANSLCKDVDPIRARKSEVCNCFPRAYHPAPDSFTSFRIRWKHIFIFFLWSVALITVLMLYVLSPPYIWPNNSSNIFSELVENVKAKVGCFSWRLVQILDQVKPTWRDLEREYNAMKEKIQGLLLKDNQSMIGCIKYQISSINPYKIHTHWICDVE